MTQRRELQAAIGTCLVGSLFVLLAVSRTWVSARIPAPAPLPSRHVELRGAHFAGGARALAFVGLAAVAALPAARRRGRVVVGALVAAAGAGTVAMVVRALVETSGLGAWPYLAILGGLLLVVAGLLVVVRGRSWASMSARYDAPAQPRPVGESSMWDALDRGEDPTGETADTGG